MSCTIVLVGGTAAEAPQWEQTRAPLLRAGHSVVTPDIDRRRLVEDAASVGEILGSLEGPLLLVGHGYGGAVISSVRAGAGDVAGLVFVEAFAPEPGESCASLAEMFAEREARDDLDPGVRESSGGSVPEAFGDGAFGDTMLGSALWRGRPTWFIYGGEDRLIEPGLQRYMSKRAASRHTVEIAGAPHGVVASHPAETADLILEAAHLPRWAEPLIP